MGKIALALLASLTLAACALPNKRSARLLARSAEP